MAESGGVFIEWLEVILKRNAHVVIAEKYLRRLRSKIGQNLIKSGLGNKNRINTDKFRPIGR